MDLSAPAQGTGPRQHFVRDWGTADPAEQFARMRDRLAVGPARLYAADVRAEIQRQRPDALLSELLLLGPLIAAEAERIPAAVLNPTINVVPAPGVPPFGFGFLPAQDEAERARDATFGQAVLDAWDVALPALNAARAENGLPPLEHVLDQGRSAALVLVLTSAAFDFPSSLPPVVQHVGPRLDDPSWSQPWQPPAGDDPLVLVATSSDYQEQEELIARAVAALASLPVRGVVTTGRGIDPATVPAPPAVQVVQSAPHSAVMTHAAAVITHAGHGTSSRLWRPACPSSAYPWGATSSTSRRAWCTPEPGSDWRPRRHRSRSPQQCASSWTTRRTPQPHDDSPSTSQTRPNRTGQSSSSRLSSRRRDPSPLNDKRSESKTRLPRFSGVVFATLNLGCNGFPCNRQSGTDPRSDGQPRQRRLLLQVGSGDSHPEASNMARSLRRGA